MVFTKRLCEGLYVVFVVLILHCIQIADSLVTVSSRSHATPQSSNTNITCTVTGDAFIEWSNPIGQRIPTDRSQRVYVVNTGDRHDLIIKDVQKDDKGTYKCRSRTKSLTFTLYVEYPPKVIGSQSTNRTQWTSYTDPNPVQITCRFDGYPVPSVAISKDSKAITKGVTKSTGSLTYRFQAQTIDDIGFYACTASNSQGDSNYYIEVSKTGRPDPPGNITLGVGCDYVRVDWVPPLSDRGSPITSYRLELLMNNQTIRGEDLSPNKRQKTFFQLLKTTGYTLRINAKNAIGTGLWETHSFNTTVICISKGESITPTMVLTLISLVLHMSITL